MDFANREEAARLWLQSRPQEKHREIFERAGLPLDPHLLICDKRAMGVGQPTAGAKAVPTNLVDTLIATLDATAPVRDVATVIEMGSGSPLQIPIVDDVENEGELIPENAEDDDTDVVIDAVTLGAYKFTSRMIASAEFMEDCGPGTQAQLGKLLGKRIGRKINTALTVGLGTDEPEGIVTASTLGKQAAGDDAVTYAELVDLQFSVDAAYQPSCQWMMSLDTFKHVRTLVDDVSRPLFLPIVAAGAPNFAGSLLGVPVIINAAMPPLAAGNRAVLYGDFSNYFVRESDIQLLIQREARAVFHQRVLLAMCRCDGKLLNTEAVRHLVMASS